MSSSPPLVLPALVLLLAAFLSPVHAGAETTPATLDAAAQFRALSAREWAWRQQHKADDEDGLGERAEHLPHVDEVHQHMRTRYWQQVLDELDALDRNALDESTQVDYDVYRQQIVTFLDQQRFRAWEMPFNSDTAFWSNEQSWFQRARQLLHARGLSPLSGAIERNPALFQRTHQQYARRAGAWIQPAAGHAERAR